MGQLPTWIRRRFRWSTTPRAWAERGAALALLLAAAGGWWISRGWGWDVRIVLAMLWLAALAYCVRREIIVLLGPVFFFELVRLGRRRVHVTRVLYAGILLITISYIYAGITINASGRKEDLSQQAETAAIFFLTFFGLQLVIVGLATPLMVAGAVADEKERRTLEFLLATDLRGREIVMGKLAARGAAVLLVLLTGLPVLALLQFFGGIDPGEMLALAVVSIVSLFSVACLSIMMSCMTRRGRDAILSTYLLMVGYLALSALARLLLMTSFGHWAIPLGSSELTGHDVVTVVTAGNPFIGTTMVVQAHDTGAEYAGLLREFVTNYAIFHVIIGMIFLGWAVYRLRPVALAQSGENRGRPRRRRRGWRPRLGTRPMIWKELFIEPGPRFHLLVRLMFFLIVLLSLWPAVQIISEYWDEFLGLETPVSFQPRAWYGYDYGHRALNSWLRTMSGLIGTLMLIGVALRAAGSLTGEKAKQTLDELLTTPLSNDEIINGKWLGALFSPRRSALWLGSAYLLCLVLDSVSVVGVLLTVAAWFSFAIFFASLGMWCSARARTTFQATTVAIFLSAVALGGHWAVSGLCCYLPLSQVGERPPSELLDITIPFQLGLTPPFILGVLPMRKLTEAEDLFDVSDRRVTAIFCGSMGPVIFLMWGLILRVAAVHRFAEKFGRTAKRRPERKQPDYLAEIV